MSERQHSQEFRPVNALLGATPKLAFLPADQIIPWLTISLSFYFLFQGLLQLGWLWTGVMIAWGCSTWWILTGSKPWKFLSKFVGTPRWSRGHVLYRSIFLTLEDMKSKAGKAGKKKARQQSVQSTHHQSGKRKQR